MLLNLDTHVLVYALAGQLKPRERRILSSATWTISAIVVWELAKLWNSDGSRAIPPTS